MTIYDSIDIEEDETQEHDSKNKAHQAFFRDPSGYVLRMAHLRRCIQPIYFKQYRQLKSSWIFEQLIKKDCWFLTKKLLFQEEELIIPWTNSVH